MDTSSKKEQPVQIDTSLFGLPSENRPMSRSREALMLRLEQMKINNESVKDTEDVISTPPIQDESKSPINCSPMKQKRSKAIPIIRSPLSQTTSTNTNRGLTEDMLFFTTAYDCMEDSDDEKSSSSDVFIPPHLQHNSYSVRSFT